MPLSEQLVQVKESAKGKFNEFADQANLKFEQSKNDPANRSRSNLSTSIAILYLTQAFRSLLIPLESLALDHCRVRVLIGING